MASLPEDVVAEILKRLPFKSIKRFSCVSKQWYALTSNPRLIKSMHLHNYYHSSDCGVSNFIVRRDGNELCETSIFILSPNGYTDQVDVVASLDTSSLQICFRVDQIYSPINGAVSTLDTSSLPHGCRVNQIFGPINGVVCICWPMCTVALWNFFSDDLKVLPMSQISHPIDKFCPFLLSQFGFGSCSNGEYKVLQLLFGSCDKYARQVEIFESSTNCWRKIDVFPPPIIPIYKLSEFRMVINYRNNTYCCWIVDAPNVILSFNFCTEKFHITHLPSSGLGHPYTYVTSFFPFNDCIALVDFPNVYSRLKRVEPMMFDIWILNKLEGAEEELWTKLLRIGPLLEVARPLMIWKNGQSFFEDFSGNIICHDAHTQTVKDSNFQIFPSLNDMFSMEQY